jgi:hypothetical protein
MWGKKQAKSTEDGLAKVGFSVGHIAEPFPMVWEFALTRFPERGRIFLYVLPDERGGFCAAFRDEKIKGLGEHPSSAVMALRKYLGGARLSRLCERRSEVVFCGARESAEDCGDGENGDGGNADCGIALLPWPQEPWESGGGIKNRDCGAAPATRDGRATRRCVP